MKNINFVEYNEKNHAPLLTQWLYDESLLDNSNRFIKFGLIDDAENIVDLLRRYNDESTELEATKRFVIFDKYQKDIAVVVLNWCDYRDISTKILSLFHIIVRPSEQRKSYGSEILRQIIQNGENLINRPYDEICSSVNKQNIPSQKLMQNLGFFELCEDGEYKIYSLNQRDRSLDE